MRILRLIAIAFTFAFLSAPAYANAILTQIGVSDTNNVRQIGFTLQDADGTYEAADGSVRTVVGDGSVRVISTGANQSIALCFRNVTFPGGITDGTSNTIQFGKSAQLQLTPGFQLPLTPVRQIVDGTSNTIIVNESPTSVCLGNVFLGGALGGDLIDPVTNTIRVGDNSNFDICLSQGNVGIPDITDGTSNTIQFGETRNNLCYTDIGVGPNLTVAELPEPSTLALFGAGLFATGFLRRRRKNSRVP